MEQNALEGRWYSSPMAFLACSMHGGLLRSCSTAVQCKTPPPLPHCLKAGRYIHAKVDWMHMDLQGIINRFVALSRQPLSFVVLPRASSLFIFPESTEYGFTLTCMMPLRLGLRFVHQPPGFPALIVKATSMTGSSCTFYRCQRARLRAWLLLAEHKARQLADLWPNPSLLCSPIHCTFMCK